MVCLGRRLRLFGIVVPLFGVNSVCAGKLGKLNWDETISSSLEYNTNINTSETDPVDDWTFSTYFNVQGKWAFTKSYQLTYGFGLGYRTHLGNSGVELDNAAIRFLPDTNFDFDMRVSKGLTINVSDSITFNDNATDISVQENDGTLRSNLFSFERLTNRFAVTANWDLNRKNNLQLSIYREDVFPLNDRFDDYRRIQHGVTGSWTHRFNARISGGIQGSLYTTQHDTNFNNESTGYSWGPFTEYAITDNMSVLGGVSWVRTDFDDTGTVSDDSDVNAIEWYVRLNHSFNSKMSYSLEYSVSNDYGYVSNYRHQDLISGLFSWQITRRGQFYVSGAYEWGNDSGGLILDDWERYIITAGYGQPFWRDFEFSTRVQFSSKDSKIADRSYEQFTFYIGIVYHFPKDK